MTALITGASSGIGRDIARELAKRGYRLIVSGRNRQALEELKNEIGVKRVKIITADLSDKNECYRLYKEASEYDVDVLINNAGFGVYGKFADTDLEKEVEMINVNITAVHILAKLFLRDFRRKNRGYILNVASAAGFMPGPYMAAYYAGKNYVVRLTEAINEELRREKSGVYIGALCPGPVDTNYNKTAGVSFGLNGLTSGYTAEYAVEQMFRRKVLIVPSAAMKISTAAGPLLPPLVLARITGAVQSRKGDL